MLGLRQSLEYKCRDGQAYGDLLLAEVDDPPMLGHEVGAEYDEDREAHLLAQKDGTIVVLLNCELHFVFRATEGHDTAHHVPLSDSPFDAIGIPAAFHRLELFFRLVVEMSEQDIVVRPGIDQQYHALERSLFNADEGEFSLRHVSVESNLVHAHIFAFYCLTVQR